ncbi:MAG: tetratricopeptide repeat protein [Myxococcales bacterium]|nr:tetratricopeptide repeat protein [Myxococcales bacterium]
MERSRKPARVEVFHFPKRRSRGAVRAAPARTQTIPEIEIAESPTESGERAEDTRKKKGRSRSSDRQPVAPVADYGSMMQLGHELFEAGRVNEARVVFEGLLAAGHRDAFCYTMLGTVCLALKDFDRALELFDQALELDPTDLAALVYRAELRLKRKKTAKAVKDLELAVKLGTPDDPFTERAKRLLALARKAS